MNIDLKSIYLKICFLIHIDQFTRMKKLIFFRSCKAVGQVQFKYYLGYIYNPLTEKETYDLITKAS